jgi:hypothetical protein
VKLPLVGRRRAHEDLATGRSKPAPGRPVLVDRPSALDVWPVRLLVILVIVLAWAILHENLPPSWTSRWPWKLRLLDVAPAAALAGGLLALIATRRQLTLTVEPHLGWSSTRDASVVLGKKSAWRVVVDNSGGGRAIVQAVEYRVVPVGKDLESQPWATVDEARVQLVGLGLVEDEDFVLRRIGAGAGIGTSKDDRVEVLAATSRALGQVSAVDLYIRYEGATRDTYARVMPLLPREGVPGIAVRTATVETASAPPAAEPPPV